MLNDSFRRRFFFFLSDARTAFWALPAFLTAFPDGCGGILSDECDVREVDRQTESQRLVTGKREEAGFIPAKLGSGATHPIRVNEDHEHKVQWKLRVVACSIR
jgi:hypothetical protein